MGSNTGREILKAVRPRIEPRRGARRFLGDLEARGVTDGVLVVATMSEFGRRPERNGSGGLDHGTAAPLCLPGPSRSAAPANMDQYYATLADTWFGVPAGDLLSGSPNALQ